MRSTSATARSTATGPRSRGALVAAGPLEHLQLMAQGEHLEVKGGPRPHDSSERQQKRDQDGHHREGSVSLSARNCNGASMYAVFSSHRIFRAIPIQFTVPIEGAIRPVKKPAASACEDRRVSRSEMIFH